MKGTMRRFRFLGTERRNPYHRGLFGGPSMPSPLRSRPRAPSSSRKVARWIPLLLLVASLFAGRASGGDGEIVDGELDLLVYFTYDEDAPEEWEAVFTAYSERLLNATEGGLQLGTVSFTRLSDLMNQADVWVLDDYSGARAHLSGLGRSGRHITISQTHRSTMGGAIGQFGLLHETGHYVWGVYDEYRGYIGNSPGSHVAHYCDSAFGSIACVMDGGTTVFPNNQRTEFCTDYALGFATTRHFPGTDDAQGNAIRTDQEYLLRTSCWTQIEASGVGELFHPLADPSGVEPPHDPVTFDYTRYGEPLAMALVIDTSGSMDAERKLEQAILGAQVGVGLLRDDEYLTVVSFDDEPTVVVPIRRMTGPRKSAAIDAIGELVAEGGTHLGIAVLEAVDQLAQADGGQEFLIVVSDGISHEPNIDDPTVLAALREGGHPVYAIALGAFPDDDAMITVAAITGGQFYKVTAAESLPGIFAAIFADAGGGTEIAEDFRSGIGGFGTRSEFFEVSEHATSVRVSLGFEAGAVLGLLLHAPDGALFDFADPPAGVEVFESEGHRTMRIPTPATGLWEALITEPFGAAGEFDFLAFVETATLDVTPRSATEAVTWPDPMRVEVAVTARFPVGGAEVDARVTRPDFTVVDLQLHDDGLPVHGDEHADDGIYTALFTAYRGDGAYVFDLDVVNVDGTAASNLECGWYGRGGNPDAAPRNESHGVGVGEEGQSSEPIAPFTAHARYSMVLTGEGGSAQTGVATLAAHPRFEAVLDIDVANSEPTPVAGFTLEVTDDEPLFLETLTIELDPRLHDVQLLDGMALHLDANGDGELDVPSLPLGRGRLIDDDARLRFEGDAAALALLAAGEDAHLLLTLGNSSGQGGAGGTIGFDRGGGRALPADMKTGVKTGGAAAVALLFWFLFRWGSSRRGGLRLRRLAPLARGAALAVGIGLAAAFSACSDGGKGGAGGIEMTVGAPGIELTGAVTSDPIVAAGEPLRFHVRPR